MPDFTPAQAEKMVRAFSNGDIENLIGERHVDVVGYNADFMYRSFISLMNNAEFKKLAVTVPTSVAHTFLPCGFSKEMCKTLVEAVSDEKYLECFDLARKLGVGIEVNTGAFKMPENDFADDAMIRVMKLAKKAGCRFTFGTDSHSLAGLDKIRMGDRISELCGIEENDLMDFVR